MTHVEYKVKGFVPCSYVLHAYVRIEHAAKVSNLLNIYWIKINYYTFTIQISNTIVNQWFSLGFYRIGHITKAITGLKLFYHSKQGDNSWK